MSYELERAVVLLAQEELNELDAAELAALVTTMSEHYKDRPRYTDTRRGVHALERARAAEENREVDYLKAEKKYVTDNNKEPV